MVRLIYLEALKDAQSCGWRFRKLTKKIIYKLGFLRLKTNKNCSPDVSTGSTALREVSLKTVQITYFKLSKQ